MATCTFCGGKGGKGYLGVNRMEFSVCGPCGGTGRLPDPRPSPSSPPSQFIGRHQTSWASPTRDVAEPLVGRWEVDQGCLDIFPPNDGRYPVREWGDFFGQSGEGEAYGNGNQVTIELSGGPIGTRIYALTFVSDNEMSGACKMWGGTINVPIAMQR